MLKTGKRLTALILTLVFMFSLTGRWPVPARAEDAVNAINRFNVMLVIDKSGSLRDQDGHGTDPDGLRFDALKLFLGLLTETGNNVGAIVFDEALRCDLAPTEMDGIEAKKALADALESFGTSFDTDIGGAVLRATEHLHGMKEANGLPCMILLLTDGMTDFTSTDNPEGRKVVSLEKAAQALKNAQEDDITINCILLNVEDRAEAGRAELEAYTRGTDGALNEVSTPEDLTAAFRRFYSIITRTEYSGSQKISFSAEGEAQTSFIAPSFGVEEVNVVVEHEAVRENVQENAVRVEVTPPEGSAYDTAGREISSSRYTLIKIPHPAVGRWTVSLHGDPQDTVDITMVYTASMSAELTAELPEPCRIREPYRFALLLSDPGVPELTEDMLRSLHVTLRAEDTATGDMQCVPMALENGVYTGEVSFSQGGDYRVSALIGLDGFEFNSNAVPAEVVLRPIVMKAEALSDMLACGQIEDGCWSIALDELFAGGEGDGLLCSLSDDCGGAVTIEDGVLKARFRAVDAAAFTVAAEDDMGQRAELPVAFKIPGVEAMVGDVRDVLALGNTENGTWELSLDALFRDPKGGALRYAVSDDCGGAVTLENGVLKADLTALDAASFTVTATDDFDRSTEIPFELNIPRTVPAFGSVADPLALGTVGEGRWELPLDAVFGADAALAYSLSDSCGGAVTLEDGVLKADLTALDAASFTVTATDVYGRTAELPFELNIPRSVPALARISDPLTVGTAEAGRWELPLDAVFGADAAHALSYSLSDSCGGAVTLEGGVLKADLTALDAASFTVTATDAYGRTAELPVELNVPGVSPELESVRDLLATGTVEAGHWELPLDSVFGADADTELRYSLSDDCGGAVMIEDGVLKADLTALDSASFTVTATDAYGRNTEVSFDFSLPTASPALESVRDLLATGTVDAGHWELPLDAMFGAGEDTELSYSLSDDCGGAVTIEDGVLKADLTALDSASFTVTATDAYGRNTEISFDLSLPTAAAALERVDEPLAVGRIEAGVWELPLDTVFDAGEGGKLVYSLSDDCGGAVMIEDGVLKADLSKFESAAFTVTAIDAYGRSTELPFELSVPAVAPSVEAVSDPLAAGSVELGVWELPLESVFGTNDVSFTLSDDCGGAVMIEDGVLKADLNGLESAAFSVTATDAYGRDTELPFELSVPAVTPTVESVSDPLAAGSVEMGLWELPLDAVFGTGNVSYSLSDDCGGAVTIEDGVLKANLNGFESAAFSVTATDAYGRTTELPFELSVPAVAPMVESVSDPLTSGSVEAGVWELPLETVFGANDVSYTLSDDCGGAVTIEDGVLKADLNGLESAAFSVIATDAYGRDTELPISLDVPAVAPTVEAVSDPLAAGSVELGVWELPLDTVFDAGEGGKLVYSLSDDCGGAVTIEGGVLKTDLSKFESAAFTVTAIDAYGRSTELPFELSVPAVAPTVENVSDPLTAGSVELGVWELPLASVFGTNDVSFTLSDDCGGAVTIEGGVLKADLNGLESAAFSVIATDAYGRDTELPFELSVPAVAPMVENVSDPLSAGSVELGRWELPLETVFGVGNVSYSLSDDCGGAVMIEDGVLKADLNGLESAAFSVTATDAYGRDTELPFELSVPAVTPSVESVSDPLAAGSVELGVWELPLDTVFGANDLSFTLSDDCGGAVLIEDGVLKADLNGLESASLSVIATDAYGRDTELPFALSVPAAAPAVESVGDMLQSGQFGDGGWTLALDSLFTIPEGSALNYTLSDDFDGALRVEDGKLFMDAKSLKEAAFTLTAADAYGRSLEIPFTLSVPAPIAKVGEIADTVKTGIFQDKLWELPLEGLFEDPKGSELSYSLTGAPADAVKITDDKLQAACRGTKELTFGLKATDEYDASAEIPVTLTEKNMTRLYLPWALLALLLIVVLVVCLRRRKKSGK